MASNSFNEVVELLANADEPVSVTAAAGCGKTEAIVRAVEKSKGKQLILTHTHAGVASLKSRFRKYQIPESKYRVATIASWLLKYVLSYGSMSGFNNPRPLKKEWSELYPAAEKLLIFPFMKEVIESSYNGIFIDEYQDCTISQHNIVKKLCEFLPVRVLGDPLQGIFGFSDDPLISWEEDVLHFFRQLPNLIKPYRWDRDGNNPLLGEQLADIRERLENNEVIDLRNFSEINWNEFSEQNQINELSKNYNSNSILGIHTGEWIDVNRKKTPLDRLTARKMRGEYQCIEEMDCYSMMNFAREFYKYSGIVNRLRQSIENFLLEGIAYNDLPENLQNEIQRVSRISEIPEIIEIALKTTPVFRKELFREMQNAIKKHSTGKYSSLEEAAYVSRNLTRVNGRKIEGKIISRTLLIKGLEFDHAVVLNANLLDRNNFYVAITRGSKSLTVLSESPVFSF
ncbi:UvrD-helicase domain-containing protein [Anaerolinea thermophila]|uniref:UvrD-helicase domain-containing protein n=1 Tax=Anaerolinea thermophila TaxID=167964 RepID=UPI0026EE91B2|nr:UvrD-helicase domain-containing protein [Anaerolinea thermophila]